ncbi:glucan endo-1,3-beta-glucosidase-like [Neltuma alba]|uniref:glucan endo-1,3-beta-glucosidase-like n=1 Tax=Neltuma alba TaxID=207710 RepID=UPI0010A42E21|nr:glucan endo-1,3-beta-glucosidase-like [Prosopis alba]
MEKAAGASLASILKGYMLLLSLSLIQGIQGIGVNYGTVANNLPPPPQVAKFLSESTIINRVRLFDANPEILRAFAHTGIEISITVPNDQIPHLTNLTFAQQWLNTSVQPFVADTNLIRILVGNEVISTANKLLISNLVPAMQTLHTALAGSSLDNRIKISTPNSLGILSNSSPPSTSRFRQGYDTHVIKPMLSFLEATDSPFMVNPYPFFGCTAETLDYALFRGNPGEVDQNTGLRYTNMLDAQLDAVYSALKDLGFENLEIVIAETGWPTLGEAQQIGVDPSSAAAFNGNLVRHVSSGEGTPLMPNRTFDAYIFALFDENLKPGPICERNFGLFRPNMTPSYDIGLMKKTVTVTTSAGSVFISNRPNLGPLRAHVRSHSWVCPKQRQAQDYICGPIQEGGDCVATDPTVRFRSHAASTIDTGDQARRRNEYDCDFEGTGSITTVDPREYLVGQTRNETEISWGLMAIGF